MLTEAIHTPYLQDRHLAIENALYVHNAMADFAGEIEFRRDGIMALRARQVLDEAITMYGTKAKGARYLEMAEGYITRIGLDEKNEIIGYEFVNLGKMMAAVKKGVPAGEALKKASGNYGRFNDAVKYVDPREE